VGCVFVVDGKVIGRGSNETVESKNATRHAEFVGRLLHLKPRFAPNRCDVFVVHVTLMIDHVLQQSTKL